MTYGVGHSALNLLDTLLLDASSEQARAIAPRRLQASGTIQHQRAEAYQLEKPGVTAIVNRGLKRPLAESLWKPPSRPPKRGVPLGIADATNESERSGEGVEHGDFPDAADAASPENRLFTSDFVLAALANLANAFGMQMLVATLPVYVLSLGGNQTSAGLVIGILPFTALLFRPLMGWLTDAWRRRPLVLIGTSCYGFANIVYLAGRFNPASDVGAVRARHRLELLHHGIQRLRGRYRPAQTAGRGCGAFRGRTGARPDRSGPSSALCSSGDRFPQLVLRFRRAGLHGLPDLALRAGAAQARGYQAAPLVPAHGNRGRRSSADGLDGALHGYGLRGRQHIHLDLRPVARLPKSRLLLHGPGHRIAGLEDIRSAAWPTSTAALSPSFRASFSCPWPWHCCPLLTVSSIS